MVHHFVDILLSKGIDRGLLGPREVDRVWDRHILNSVAIADLVPVGVTLIDVGSGAGLPGIPLAILRPDLKVALLEPLLRRSVFLAETIADLGLASRVLCVRGRAEEHQARYDVVTARAVAPLDRLAGWCAPLRSPGGAVLALKGDSAQAELHDAAPVLRRLGLDSKVLIVRAHPAGEPTTVVRLTERARNH